MDGGKRKLRFYFPNKKVDSETQTLFGEAVHATEKTLTDQMRDITINAILDPVLPQASNIDKSLMIGCKSEVGHYVADLNDERFEILTPPNDLYRDLPVGVTFEFHTDKFVILNSDFTKSREYTYDISRWPLVEPLETGKLTLVLFSVFDELQVTKFDNGSLICHIIDFRHTPEKLWKVKLTVTDEIIRSCANKAQTRVSADFGIALEAKSLLRLKPFICTDPSPNVSRVFSELDRVSKMWNTRPPQEKDFRRQSGRRIIVPETPPIGATAAVKIPQNIMNTSDEMLKTHQ